MAYVLITAFALVFLNTYSAKTTRNLVFCAQHNSMQDKAQLIVSALSDTDELTEEAVSQTVRRLSDLHTTRVVVSDAEGCAVYDSLTVYAETGSFLLFPEIVEALRGNDVFYGSYEDDVLVSRQAMPIYCHGVLTGAVYLIEYDVDQGALVSGLQKNILRISMVLEAAIVLFSLVIAVTFSRRMRHIVKSVKTMRKGDYSYKIRIRGHDEVGMLAQEFNELAERLQRSEEVRRRFVSDASHELKTPLASIKLLSDSILQNEMDMATVREFVGDVGAEADRLTRLSEKLLDLTKMDAEQEGELELVDAMEVAAKVQRMLEPLSTQHGITVERRLEAGCAVLSVEDDLYQIIFNLMENAIKYNRENGWIGLYVQKEAEEVCISVEDNGIGIPADALEHIFERFYRVDKARSRRAGGSGLGLSIVHDMVERNYGTIQVARRAAGGTGFYVRFPLVELEEDGDE